MDRQIMLVRYSKSVMKMAVQHGTPFSVLDPCYHVNRQAQSVKTERFHHNELQSY